jgi:hypothetical protein
VVEVLLGRVRLLHCVIALMSRPMNFFAIYYRQLIAIF